MKKLVALVATLVASISALAFNANFTPAQVNAEVLKLIAEGKTDTEIASAALKANIAPATVSSALTAAGRSVTSVNASIAAAVVANAAPTAAGPATDAPTQAPTVAGTTPGTSGS